MSAQFAPVGKRGQGGLRSLEQVNSIVETFGNRHQLTGVLSKNPSPKQYLAQRHTVTIHSSYVS